MVARPPQRLVVPHNRQAHQVPVVPAAASPPAAGVLDLAPGVGLVAKAVVPQAPFQAKAKPSPSLVIRS